MLHGAYRYCCPRKWGYKYILGLPEEPSIGLIVGSAMDDGLNTYYNLRIEGVEALEAGAKGLEIAVAAFQEEVGRNPDLFTEIEDGTSPKHEAMLAAAYTAFLVHEGQRTAVKVQDKHSFVLKVDGEPVSVLGFSDRIDADGTICDHKFSGSARWDRDGKWHDEYLREKSDQLLLYWLSRQAEEKRTGPLDPPLSGKARLIVVFAKTSMVKPQVRAIEIQLDLDRGKELLYRIGQAYMTRRGGLHARPGPGCSFCSFLERCQSDEAVRGTDFTRIVEVPF